MSFTLPTKPELLELIDLPTLASLNFPTFVEASNSSRRSMVRETAIRSMTYIIIRANDDIELVRFNRNRSFKTLWTFGKLVNGITSH